MFRDLSLHIQDLAENAIRAQAAEIGITIEAAENGFLNVEIRDNGAGMDERTLRLAWDPFGTTRKNRSVGLGLPFFRMACEVAGGTAKLHSEPGKGTTVCGSFSVGAPDRIPLGDLGETLAILILEKPECAISLQLSSKRGTFSFRTDVLAAELEPVPVTEFPVLRKIKDYVNDGVLNIFGGVLNEIIGRAQSSEGTEKNRNEPQT